MKRYLFLLLNLFVLNLESSDFGLDQKAFLELVENFSEESETSSFYHYLKASDLPEKGSLTLEDESVYQIGWWYRGVMKSWKPGDRLKVSYHEEHSSGHAMKIENVETLEEVWGTCTARMKYDHVRKVETIVKENKELVKVVLDSGWFFEVEATCNLKKMQRVFIFHYGNDFRVLNIDDPAFIYVKNLQKEMVLQKKDMFESVLNLEEKLNNKVLKQENAAKVVTDRILNYLAGLNDPQEPIGAFLFLGPTGVGKTEMAKALAEELYGDNNHLIRFDMAQFQAEYAATRFFGAPPGYLDHENGGQLTEELKAKPESVVLFDEIEKAHPKIWKIFLPVFDEGYIVDSANTHISCRKIIFIATSNLCSQEITKLTSEGFSAEEILASIEPILIQQLTPEFYNRLEPVIFSCMDESTVRALSKRLLDAFVRKVKTQKNIDVYFDASVEDYLSTHGWHPNLGVRPLKRLLQKKIISLVSYAIINENLEAGSSINVAYDPTDDTWDVSTSNEK